MTSIVSHSRTAAALVLLAGCAAAAASLNEGPELKDKVIISERLPLTANGDRIRGGRRAREESEIKRTFRFRTPGVYYLWLKLSTRSRQPLLLTYRLEGDYRLRSARSRIQVHPATREKWIGHSMHPEFNAEVHVADPGDYELTIRALRGEAEVHKIALTLYHSAKPKGDTLDHTGDPGFGNAAFPRSSPPVDGFRKDWESPPVEARRRYYVDSEKGDDSNSGLGPGKAWRSFSNVNGRKFHPGDAILLKRGGKWDEGLAPKGSGTAADWITLGAYGKGPRPRVHGAGSDGLQIKEQSYWVVQDLELSSDPGRKHCGISVLTFEGNPQPKGIKIFNVVAYDNGPAGIIVGSWHGEGNGYDGVWIENCLTFANDSDGIVVCGSDQTGCRNSVIRYCTAYSNLYGGGIWIHSGQNGLIEHCVAYNNACINIWTWNSRNVTIRYCEAYRGRTPRDAGGFDIDWGCEACTMEYCYSHHNEGVGFLVMGSGKKPYRGFPMQSRYNILRYCVSENDSPGIGMCETFQHGKIYNNLAVTAGKGRTAMDVSGWPFNPSPWGGGGGWPSDTQFYNNILIGRKGALPAFVDDHATRQGNMYDHNLYLRTGAPGPIMRWGGIRNGPKFWEGKGDEGTVPPDDFSSLEKLRAATGQEKGGALGDPLFAAPSRGEIGRLPLKCYALRPGSPAAGTGRRVTLDSEWLAGRDEYLTQTGASDYGIPMAPSDAREDYWGRPIKKGDKVSIGPYQH